MNEDTILRKIQKALALANDKRGDANTAAIALRQAQAMMEKHNISQQRVLAANCAHADLRSKVSVKNPAQWEANVLFFVGEAFGCKCLWTSGGPQPTNKGYWTVIGPAQYVEVAQYTIAVTMRAILKARANFVKEFRDSPGMGRSQKSRFADDFCLGWGWAVRREIHKMADPDGLVDTATKAYMEEHFNLKPMDKLNDKSSEGTTFAMKMGAASGSEFKIHRPMNDDGTEQLKIEKE
jgi:hypothetical protein